MTEAYNDALAETLESNVWSRLADEATSMSKMEYATLSADIVGIFDPTPVSDGVGFVLSAAQGDILGAGLSLLGMVPYVGDLGKIGKIAKVAPRTARALELMLRKSDELASLGAQGLKKAFSLRQVADARAAAAKRVKQAMLDARNKKPNCKDCKKLKNDGKRNLQMPNKGGKWDTPDGKPPTSGTGKFTFDDPKTLPDGRQVDSIDFIEGEPDFSSYAHDNAQYNLWEVTGDVGKDETALKELMGDGWSPPNTANTADGYVLHHASDGSVMYVPRVLHDKGMGGVAHTGGNSIVNNDLF
ncbi:hypothetical protein IV417_10710 [Alphaproteobacteria bacterium KMM 3653]|uniref:Uncharacterized protein n=1 Tax=Harenicola maris TaxID=2841044 RepID=A0AAP2CNV0_9RHOB|nr:hypothetical protein [Harenicola maris]